MLPLPKAADHEAIDETGKAWYSEVTFCNFLQDRRSISMKHSRKRRILALLIACLLVQTVNGSAASAGGGLIETAMPAEAVNVVSNAEGCAVVQNSLGDYALLNAAGEYLVSYGDYPWIGGFSEGLCLVKAGTVYGWHWAYLNTSGQEVLSAADWDQAGDFHNGLARVQKGTTLGFIDTEGNLVLNCSDYSQVGEFSDGCALVAVTRQDETTYSFIDTTGNVVIGGLLWASDFSGGYALVQVYNTLSRKTVTCLIDTTGIPTVDLSAYSNLSPVSDGLILVNPQTGTQMDTYGYMDSRGRVVIDCTGCEFVYPFSDGLALTEYLDGAGNLCYAYLDGTGERVIDLGSCDLACSYCDGYAICQEGNEWYLMNTWGRTTYRTSAYDGFDSYSDGVLVAHVTALDGSKRYTLMDAYGTVLAANLDYDHIDAFSQGLALAYTGEGGNPYHYCFIDAQGTVVLDCSDYDTVGSFSDGLLLVSRYETDADGHFSGIRNLFIDQTGAVVLDCSDYSYVDSFSSGLAQVGSVNPLTLQEQIQFIDRTGTVVLDCSEYDKVSSFQDGVCIVARNSGESWTYALMDQSGALLTDWLAYNTVSGYAEGYAVVNRTSTQGAVEQAFYMYTDGSTALSGLGYSSYESFHDGYAIVGLQQTGGMVYGCINKSGALVISLLYDRILPFSQGCTWARRDGIWYSLALPRAESIPEPEPEPSQPLLPVDLPATLTGLPFTDVAQSAWYYDNVRLACTLGLMNGITTTTFDPEGTVTLAQAVTLAVRAYCQCRSLPEITIAADGAWYQPYVDYAISVGILSGDEFGTYDRDATRAELAYLFAHVLPDSGFEPINDISSIQDVTAVNRYYSEILTMYRAGVLTGYTDGSFQPDNTVKRSEVAAIISRVVLPDQRKVI